MKLYNSVGPNPHVVRMFAAEVGVALELEEVDLMGGANRQSDYLKVNPAGQLPCLEAKDGTPISEVTAICEYLDEVAGGTSLIGTTAEQRAETRMWTRRVDLGICETLANGFRYSQGLALFKDRMVTIPEAADGLKSISRDRQSWLNEQMAPGQPFIAGERLSLADILLYCVLTFGKTVGQPYDESLAQLHAWYQGMDARASAKA